MGDINQPQIKIFSGKMIKKLDVIEKKINFYNNCGLKIHEFCPEKESSEYHAHTFTLQDKKVLFRIAKKTPTKTGYFVTIWKRGTDSIIAPYNDSDPVDFVVVVVSDDNHNLGEFIFPKSILLEKGIFSTKTKEGKRAIRVYAPWDTPTSVQATKTQKWQNLFFVDISSFEDKSFFKTKNLFSI